MMLFQRVFVVFAVSVLTAIFTPNGRAAEQPAMTPATEAGVTIQLPSGAVILLPAGDAMSMPHEGQGDHVVGEDLC